MASPVFTNLSPADATQEVAQDSAISVEITDADGDLAAATVEITVDGVVAWTTDAVANGWTGTKNGITNGYRYDLTPPSNYPMGKNIVVRLYAEDGASNILDDSTWNFFTVGIHVFFGRGLSSSQILYSRDGGQTWGTIHANWDSSPNEGIAFPSLDLAWGAVPTDGGGLLRVRYGTNLTFSTAVRPPWLTFTNPECMHASAVDNVWIGGYGNVAYQYISGDRTVSGSYIARNITGVANVPNQGVTGLFAISQTNVWACSKATNGGFIYRWTGSAWSQPALSRPWNTMWDSCHGSAADNIVFCGGIGSNTHGVVRRWNGSTFDDLSLTSQIGSADICDVYTSGPDAIWVAVGSTTNVHSEHGIWFWDGAAWTQVFSPLTGSGNVRRWDSITGHGAYKVYAVSDHVEGTDKTGPVAIWDGNTWTEVDSGLSHGSNSPKAVRDLYSTLPVTPPDTTAPVLQNLDPDVDDIGVAIDSDVTLEIFDDESGVDEASVILSVNVGSGAVVAWQSNAQQNGFAVTKSAVTDGFRYVITPPTAMPSYQLVSVRVQADDVEANSLDSAYSFTTEDASSPTITSPFPTGVDVPASSNISYSLEDIGSGVSLATVNTTVDGAPAVTAGVIQAGFDGAGSGIVANGSGGYDVVLAPTSIFGEAVTVSVSVSASDVSGNPVLYPWTFDVEDYLGPLVTPLDPGQGGSSVVIGSDVEVSVTDPNLMPGGLIVEIDRDGEGFAVAYTSGDHPNFKEGWDGERSAVTTIANGYRIVVDPVPMFLHASTVRVRVTALDSSGNPERLP